MAYGPCVACNKPSEVGHPARRGFILRDGESEPTQLPPQFVCQFHFQELRGGRLLLGWCESEECRKWGIAGTESPCGERFA
jgi:hypothetical protein